MTLPASIVHAFAPQGRLRASINLGNPVLAGRDASGAPCGVTVDLAQAFAQRLGVPLELMAFDTAGQSVEAVAGERADIGFFAIDPKRGEHVAFTPPYVLIEGCYLVCDDSPLQANDAVDRAGCRVVVGAGSAYDLYLSRELKQAQIVRVGSSAEVVPHFLQGGGDVAAGVKQQLQADTQGVAGVRLLPGRFMVIRQAMGCPRSRGAEAAAALSEFIEEMKATGFVADALKRHGIAGASVAPAGA
ncbi:ABC transporter substrate-binding protein [Ramlibacter ginsenosidimutans]|uniref:ABC transporter substrate-binding protein n=1 Tax=Ramlibacter ginsenosidimutans TaxID=502333 RepID=A0A934WQM0_9BURK|nr:ABC transporter substrate-binding protein [Ramlibacter ginsenosidimutans]MBK6009467.1 ABC transporter substrate-binding protein [Ramlibacter ginsenosidimutans]